MSISHQFVWLGCVVAVLMTSGRTGCGQQLPEATSSVFSIDTRAQRIDTDGDGMPNEYELVVGLDPAVKDDDQDPDGDGLTNLEEYGAGTSPFSADAGTVASSESALFTVNSRTTTLDTDGDGMPDWWEMQNGLNQVVSDAGEDLDGDGLRNLVEYNGGTDPRSANASTESASTSGLFAVNTSEYSYPITTDTDNDGMPDWWELKYRLNPNLDDSLADADRDGVSNLLEFRYGLDPTRSQGGIDAVGVSGFFTLNTVNVPPDTDGDGIRDYWEVAHGLDPNKPDADGDPDGDGRTNLEEYNAGTDPHVDDWRGPTSAISALFIVDTGGFVGGEIRDSDGDGMPDWWEMKYGLNINANDAAGDADGDGLTNLAEYRAGGSPQVWDTLDRPVFGISGAFLVDTGGRDFDTDGDGLPDWWEKLYFNDARVAAPDADVDRDGFTNLEEFLAGSDPVDAGSLLRIVELSATEQPDGAAIVVRWVSFTGGTYSIWEAAVMEGPFSLVATNVAATPPLNSTFWTTAAAQRFVRVRSDGVAR